MILKTAAFSLAILAGAVGVASAQAPMAMQMSHHDMMMMNHCKAMSHSRMMHSSTCRRMMKMHPDMMKSDGMMQH